MNDNDNANDHNNRRAAVVTVHPSPNSIRSSPIRNQTLKSLISSRNPRVSKRTTLLELTRHPAHHLKASEPFWKLRPFEGAPNLPTGYFGLFWPCMIPPLWRKLMDHRIPET